MTKQLTTQNATITTVAVEVKALAISGKQVTLSVFRQLQEEQLVADDGTLNGVPWGYVNYHPDRCGDQADHWHVVWQKSDQLRRSLVVQEPRWPALRVQETHHLLNAHLLAWALNPEAPASACPIPGRATRYGLSPREIGKFQWVHPPTGVTFTEEATPTASELAQTLTPVKRLREMGAEQPQFKEQNDAQADAREEGVRYRQLLAKLREDVEGYGRTVDELMEDVSVVAANYVQRQDRHRMVRAGLAQLPQLFIAV
jgi:hypothetical protein